MASGPYFPSSIYLGGASGNLSSTVYVPNTNTNNAGAIEGIGVVASLGADAAAVLQFNLPEAIPAGTAKLRLLAMANATSGVAKLTVSDGVTATGSNLGGTSLTPETQLSQTWSTADVVVENKISLAASMVANSILTVLMTFNTSGWTLAQTSVWQASLVWE
jgi:hypothetical protein